MSAARLWYLRATAQFGWSRNVLLNQIKGGACERAVTEKKVHNFDLALPEHQGEPHRRGGVYELQAKLPGELKGKLPTAKQLADVVRAEMGGER